MIKRFVIAIILIGLVCGGLVYFNIFRDRMIAQYFAAQPRPVVTVSTITVEPETWQPGIEAIGTAFANRGVDVATRAAGIVKEIKFSSNDDVEEGQLLVQLDDETEQADLIAAKANIERDTAAKRRAETLSDRGFGSTETLDNAIAALDAARSMLERVQAAINQKRIVAPFSGTIGIPRVDLGQYLPVGTVIATLQDLDTMKVDFSVPEQQIHQLKIGQSVRIGISEEDLPYQGKITGIDPKINPSSRLVAVQAHVDNKDGGLRPGQFVFVRIELPEEKDIIALPQTAVVQSLYGTYVYSVVEEQASDDPAQSDQAEKPEEAEKTLIARQIFVTPGRRFGGRIEIVDGLKPGDVVVTAGQNKLSVGSPVTIDNTVNPVVIGQSGT